VDQQITLAYSLAILLLGCGAAFGGLALPLLGPRRVGLVAATSMASVPYWPAWPRGGQRPTRVSSSPV
jgi:hypothetical protein